MDGSVGRSAMDGLIIQDFFESASIIRQTVSNKL